MKGNAQVTKLVLTGGIIAGPIYIIVGLAQILTREGFDMTRHPLSMLSLGDLGWIQITNFLVTGFLVLLAAISLRRLAGAEKRLRRGAFFLGLYAVCVLSGGIFSTDPSLGFPPGTPDIYPETFSWHGLIHFIAGQVAFISIIVASFVYGKYFAVNQERKWATFSRLTGSIYLVGIIAPIPAAAMMSTSGMAWASIFLYAAVALGWVWLSALIVRMRASA
ncbi:MAG: DUF998 domain-containing protein [Anaerolineales bacterium]|nr:DUF998 domain-containing protein [Anaerolineales bacterium]